MRRYLVVSTFLLFLLLSVIVPVVGVCADYTITPWPYGAIVWVQEAQLIGDNFRCPPRGET